MSIEPGFQRRFYEWLLRSQSLPAEDLVGYQRSKLDRLVRLARDHTRFYRARLDPLFRADDSINWDAWRDVPVLRRSDILADPAAFQPDIEVPEDGATGEIKTSGSTGHPMTVRYNERTALATRAIKWRSDVWHRVDWSKTLYVQYGASKTQDNWPRGAALGPWGPPWDERARRGKAFQLNQRVSNDKHVEFIRRVGANYMAPMGPKTAHELAVEVELQGLTVKLDGIFVSGENVDSVDRDICRRVFGSDLLDVYSSKEGNHMAHRCPDQPGYHVSAETILIEVLDEKGQPCRPGETGRVIITPLFSSGQPLIRYDHGDLATVGERCACGRTLPVLSSMMGRLSQLFRHPDGRVIRHQFPDEYRGLLRSGPWQIAQVGPTDYELRYVPLEWEVLGDEGAVRRAFLEYFFADSTLTFRRVRAIAPVASGKYMEYVNEYNPLS